MMAKNEKPSESMTKGGMKGMFSDSSYVFSDTPDYEDEEGDDQEMQELKSGATSQKRGSQSRQRDSA